MRIHHTIWVGRSSGGVHTSPAPDPNWSEWRLTVGMVSQMVAVQVGLALPRGGSSPNKGLFAGEIK